MHLSPNASVFRNTENHMQSSLRHRQSLSIPQQNPIIPAVFQVVSRRGTVSMFHRSKAALLHARGRAFFTPMACPIIVFVFATITYLRWKLVSNFPAPHAAEPHCHQTLPAHQFTHRYKVPLTYWSHYQKCPQPAGGEFYCSSSFRICAGFTNELQETYGGTFVMLCLRPHFLDLAMCR